MRGPSVHWSLFIIQMSNPALLVGGSAIQKLIDFFEEQTNPERN